MEIGKFTFLGILSCVGGFGVFIFQGIAQAMKDTQWTNLLLGNLTGGKLDGFAQKIPLEAFQTGFHYMMYTMPFYQLLLVVGGVFIVLGMWFRN